MHATAKVPQRRGRPSSTRRSRRSTPPTRTVNSSRSPSASKRRVVRASEMINGAEIAGIAQAAIERACVRESQNGSSGVELHDVLAGVGAFLEKSMSVLTPANCRNYLEDLPQDVDVVRVEPVRRRVRDSYQYFNQVA